MDKEAVYVVWEDPEEPIYSVWSCLLAITKNVDTVKRLVNEWPEGRWYETIVLI